MTQGVAMFCYDSDFEYSRICNFNIKQIKKFLDVPVIVYTDVLTAKKIKNAEVIITSRPEGNSRFFRPQERSIPWYNLNRKDVLFDPPYDKTLVIDVDYIVMSDCLKELLKSNYDFACYKNVRDATGCRRLEGSSIGHSDIDFCWATVMLVTRSVKCKNIGYMLDHIQTNYKYFMRLYRVSDSNTYRNDYALSIALHQLNGMKNEKCFIPGNLATIPDDVPVQVSQDTVNFVFRRDNQTVRSYLKHTDVHILNKEAQYA
jgi:hypothetical protein